MPNTLRLGNEVMSGCVARVIVPELSPGIIVVPPLPESEWECDSILLNLVFND